MPVCSYSFKPKRSLGQNFLVDDNIARKVVRSLHLDKRDVFLEIGPGQGALTRHLADNVRHLVAVEIDGRAAEELQRTFVSPSVTILHADFLTVELSDLHKEYGSKLRVIGNIPYHLTSPILFKVFDQHLFVRDVTTMMQKEVAERLVARPGTKDCGILSVFCLFFGVAKILFTVSPNCFYPKPKVTSAVVQMSLHEKLAESVDADIFKTIVKTAFGKRRKTLRNSLKFLPFDENIVADILSHVTIPLKARAEELTLEQWVQLTKEVDKCRTG